MKLEANLLPRITIRTPNVLVVRAILAIAKSPNPTNVLAAAEAIEAIAGIFVHRIELWPLIKRSIAVKRDEELDTTLEAAVIVRDRTRENGRVPQQQTVSRTLLVKGLEYDHAIVLNADLLNNAQDFLRRCDSGPAYPEGSLEEACSAVPATRSVTGWRRKVRYISLTSVMNQARPGTPMDVQGAGFLRPTYNWRRGLFALRIRGVRGILHL